MDDGQRALTVDQSAVVAKLIVVAATPYTLSCALRLVVAPLTNAMLTVAVPAALADTPLNWSVPELLPTWPTLRAPVQPLQVATEAPPASVLLDDSAS
jgi:hypothetical protein